MTNYLSIFKFSCSTTNGVDILVLGLQFHCSCEGEEVWVCCTFTYYSYSRITSILISVRSSLT